MCLEGGIRTRVLNDNILLLQLGVGRKILHRQRPTNLLLFSVLSRVSSNKGVDGWGNGDVWDLFLGLLLACQSSHHIFDFGLLSSAFLLLHDEVSADMTSDDVSSPLSYQMDLLLQIDMEFAAT